MKENKLKPYKIHYLQKVLKDDLDRRIDFSEIMMQNFTQCPYFTHKIVFSDENTFYSNGPGNITIVEFESCLGGNIG